MGGMRCWRGCCSCMPTDWLEKLLATAAADAGRRRCWWSCWSRASGTWSTAAAAGSASPGVNFQASEGARVLVLIYIASYCRAPRDRAAQQPRGLLKPLACCCCSAVLLLASRTSAPPPCWWRPASGCCSWPARSCAGWLPSPWALGALGALAVLLAPYRLRRLTDVPGSLGRSLQQRLPAHAVADRDRTRRVVRRRPRARACRSCSTCPRRTPTFCSRCWPRSWAWPAWCSTLGLFLALVWRVFHIARLADDAGLKFQSYLAASFGLWLGIQACINIGVNMGAAADQGPDAAADELRPQQPASLRWRGSALILRVYHEATGETRGMAATVRRRRSGAEAAA